MTAVKMRRMFSSIFDTAEVDAFAAWVADELRKALSPADCEKQSKRSDDRVQRLNTRVARRAQELVASSRLNVYKKAKLGTRLQELVAAAGYPASFTQQFAYDVTALVATAHSGRS